MARAGGAGDPAALLVHEALHATVASRAWICSRHRAFRGMDRGPGSLDPRILLLTAAVTFWVAGFDILYTVRISNLTGIPGCT